MYAETFFQQHSTYHLTFQKANVSCLQSPHTQEVASVSCHYNTTTESRKRFFYKTVVAEVHGAKRISSSLVHTESDFLEYLDSLPLECPNVICGLHNWPELLKNKSLMGWYTLPFKYLGLVIFCNILNRSFLILTKAVFI